MANKNSAEMIALQALGFLATDEKLLERFMALSGMSPGQIKLNAGNLEFLAGVLDFFLGNEADLLAFCEAEKIEPDLPAKARMQLPGANTPY